jgi:hypothetical protein
MGDPRTATPLVPRNIWRDLADEELRHYLRQYRRDLTTIDRDDRLDAETRAETGDYLAMLVADGEREWARRERAARLGVPLDAERFTPAFLDDLKAGVRLDDLFAHEFGAQLRAANAQGWRRGPCPICHSHSDNPFGVFIADERRQCYTCFVCHACGDAINAIRQAYGDSFVGAVERLARHGGIALPPPPQAAPTRPKPVATPYKKRHRGAFLPP